MARIKSIQQLIQTQDDMITTTNGTPVSLQGALTYGAQCVVDVDTPSAKTFDSGVAASLIVQDLTYTADLRGTAGNSITIAYTSGGTAGAEVVTVVASAISVQIDVTAITGSSATQVKAAVDASVAASALISVAVTGSGATVQAAAAATPLAGGINSEVDVTENSVAIPTHGYVTGLKGQLTTTGTLPVGLSLGTDYFIIVVDASNVKFATTLANALAGTPVVDITSQGVSASVNTFTPTAIAGATVKLQKSNDSPDSTPVNWSDEGSATNITVDANLWLEKVNPSGNWMRLVFTITAGSMSSVNTVSVKGPD